MPSAIRTGQTAIPKTVVEDISSPTVISSPTILHPQPLTSRLLRASPATEYPVRSVSPDLVPDRMAERTGVPDLTQRLTPHPEPSLKREPSVDLVPDRMAERTGVPDLTQRLTPTPEQYHNHHRQPSGELVPDRMAERVVGAPELAGRLTPSPPEKQQQALRREPSGELVMDRMAERVSDTDFMGRLTPNYTLSRQPSADFDLIPDRMAERVGAPELMQRLTPNPEQQQQRTPRVSA